MLKISKAALVAAALSLSVIPVMVAQPALAEDSASPKPDLGFQLSIPSVVTSPDSSMSEDAIRDALGGNFLNHVDDLAGLTAASITIPTITLTTTAKVGGESSSSTATYTNLVLSNVKDGVAGSFSVDKTESVSKDGTFTYLKMTQQGLNIPGIFALIGLIPGQGTDFAPISTSFNIEGATFASDEVTCSIGPWTGTGGTARPVATLLKDVIAAGGEIQANPKAPPAAAMKVVASYVTDILTAFTTEPTTISSFDCKGTPDGKPVEVAVDKLTIGGFEPGIYPSVAIDGLRIDAGEQGTFSVGKAEFKSTDLNPPIEAVKADIDNLSPEWFDKNARKLIPSFAGFDLSDIKVDVPDPENEGSRLTASVGEFDLTLSDYRNGIPTKVSSFTHQLDVPLDQKSEDDNVKMLLALGLTRVNLNYDFSAGWDADSKTINVDQLSISGNDLGSFAVAAVIGNAVPELFDLDPSVEEAAGMGLTVKDIKLHAVDEGIGDLVAPMLAAQQNADPDAYRQQMAGIAEGTALAMLGSTDAARALGKVVGDFITGTSKSVSIDIAAKDETGVPVMALMQAGNDPRVLTGAFDITGTAE